MEPSEVTRAVAAAVGTVTSQDLAVDDAVVVNNSNKLAVRLLPCDVLARVAPEGDHVAEFEIDLAQRLAGAGSPVARLDPRVAPRVHRRDGFAITVWTYYPPVPDTGPADYAAALGRLHAGLRTLDVRAPHVTERVEQAQHLLADHDRTPELTAADRAFLTRTLRSSRRAVDGRGSTGQLLHGEPHPGNLLATAEGSRFIDFETCCRGPVEFDLAHAPEDVHEHYPGIDRRLLLECRVLVLAMITTWRWDRDDQFPDGRRRGRSWLGELRAMVHRHHLDPGG